MMATSRSSQDTSQGLRQVNGDAVQNRAPFADNPTHGLVPLKATEVFLQRLSGWTQLLKRLIVQFEMVVDHQKRLAEAYGKCAKDFALPVRTREEEEIFGGDETTLSLFRSIQQSHSRASEENAEAAAMMETHVLPNLRSLLAELRRKASDTDREWVTLDKEFQRDLDLYVKLAGQLKTSLAKHNGEYADGPEKEGTTTIKDPWAANINMKRHIATCIYKQEHYRAALLSQQQHFATFESTIVQTLRVTLSTFFDWQLKDIASAQDTFRKLKNSLHTLDIGKDWESFRQRHVDRIIDKDVPIVKESEVDYDGRDDPLVQSQKEGLLYRRDTGMKFGFKKAWKETWVVVTAAGYLHVLPPAQSGGQPNSGDSEAEPELSLYLPDCIIGPLMMNEKEPEEFVVQEKSGGMFGGERKHKFKGANMDQSAMWWSYLGERIRTTKNRAEIISSTPSNGLRRGSTDSRTATSSPRTSTSSNRATDPLSGAPVAVAVAPPAPRVEKLKADPLGVGAAKPALVKPIRATSTPVPVSQAKAEPVTKPASQPKPVSQQPLATAAAAESEQEISSDDDIPLGLNKRPSLQPITTTPFPSESTDNPKLSLTERMEAALSSAVVEESHTHGFAADPWGNPTDLWGSTASLAETFTSGSNVGGLSSAMERAARLGELEDDDLGGSAWA